MNRILLSLVVFLGLFVPGNGQITNPAYRTVWVLDSIYDFRPAAPNQSFDRNSVQKYAYDNQGRVLMFSYGKRIFTNGVAHIEYTRKYTYQYNSNGDRVLGIQYNMDSSLGWVMQAKSVEAYDANRNLVLKIDSTTDANNQLVQLFKQTYIYNANNQLIGEFHWDGRSTVYERKITHEYYPYGKIKKTLVKDKSWNQPNPTWNPEYRRSFYYDVNQQDSMRVYEEYYASINAFDTVYVDETSHTSNGLLTYQKTFNVGRWMHEVFYSYDSDDILRKKETIGFDDDYGNFVKNYEDIKLFDADSNQVLWTQKRDDGNGYRKQFSHTANYVNNVLIEKHDTAFDFYNGTAWSSSFFSYNGNGDLVLKLDSNFRASGFTSMNAYSYSYNANHQLRLREVYGSSMQNGTLVSYQNQKNTYQYDVWGYLTERVAYVPDTNQQWAYDSMFVYVNDSLGMALEKKTYRYLDLIAAWEMKRIDSMVYRPDIKVNSMFVPIRTKSFFLPDYEYSYLVNEIKTAFIDDQIDTLSPVFKGETYYYSRRQILVSVGSLDTIQVNVAELENVALLVYPNPVQNYVFVDGVELGEIYQFRLFDLSGREMLTQRTASSAIDLSEIKSGNYIYMIQYQDKMHRGKLVKL